MVAKDCIESNKGTARSGIKIGIWSRGSDLTVAEQSVTRSLIDW